MKIVLKQISFLVLSVICLALLPSFTTVQAEDITFSDIKVTKITKSSVFISWKTNIKTNSEIVYGEKTQALDSDNNKPFFKDAGANKSFDLLDHSLTLTGLKTDTEYHYVVRGSPNKDTKSIASGEGTFRTAKADGTGGSDGGQTGGGTTTGVSGDYEKIRNPVSSETFIGLAFRIMRYLLGAIAGIAVVFIMFGAIELMVSRGNQELITRGKDTILWAVVGLTASLFAFSLIAILQNLLSRFFGTLS